MQKDLNVSTQNKSGKWVPAIPEPYYLRFKKECWENGCFKKFWTKEGYRAHYALKHILEL